MSRAMRRFIARGLLYLERRASSIRSVLCEDDRSVKSLKTQTTRPNSANEWNDVYSVESLLPITQLTSPVARILEQLTKADEVLLEMGCGSASISAELAHADRRVRLVDFSPSILDRALQLFQLSGLSAPEVTVADITKPLPLADKIVDVVWSSGVLEHWTDVELPPILKEMRRVSRRAVIALVPYAGCVSYRWGKAVMEAEGRWPYGRELPRASLKLLFEQADLRNIHEFTIWPEVGVGYLKQISESLYEQYSQWWSSLPDHDVLRRDQGYLLVTVGHL